MALALLPRRLSRIFRLPPILDPSHREQDEGDVAEGDVAPQGAGCLASWQSVVDRRLRVSTMARCVSARRGERETRARRLDGMATHCRRNSKMPSAGAEVRKHLVDQLPGAGH